MRIKFILLILLQVLLLAGIIGYREYWIATGDRVLLRTAPVDPRDIFRGDYVQLSYDITNLDLDILSAKEDFRPNEKIYVALVKNEDGTYRALSAGKAMPQGVKFIQGRVKYETPVTQRWEIQLKDDSGNIHALAPRWFSGVNTGDRVTFCLGQRNNVVNYFKEDVQYKPYCSPGNLTITGTIEDIKEIKFRQVNVEYGIESYFVEEGKGRAIESARNAKEVKVEVALKKDGKGIITGLMMDSKTVSAGMHGDDSFNLNIGFNPKVPLHKMKKQDIFALRKSKVDEYGDIGIYSKQYIPEESIFGKIDEQADWVQDTQFFIVNPYLLVVDSAGEYVDALIPCCPALSILYSKNKISVKYENEPAKKWLYYINDYYKDSKGVVRLWFVNALDAGFKYAYVDSSRSMNVEPAADAPADHVMKGIYSPREFFHVGHYKKNNISPNDPKAKLKLKDKNGRTIIYVKLWRNQPATVSAQEDFAYVIEVNPDGK
ncbi:MAG: hypothetical protein FD156_1365 [Nitrospirae bacterium]|nr:MAG: hypothetical protein FD156_1365 [Nitrospirota bacterium]